MAKLKLKSSQWIVDEDNNIIIGEGRAKILENIAKTGSMSRRPLFHYTGISLRWRAWPFDRRFDSLLRLGGDRRAYPPRPA